jgi:hypothetical protein
MLQKPKRIGYNYLRVRRNELADGMVIMGFYKIATKAVLKRKAILGSPP